MTNSLDSHIAGYIHALFKDLAWVYSRNHELVRDRSRLLHELEHHGVQVCTLWLPALDKHLLRCLAGGLYTRSGLPLGRVGARFKVPELFRDLYLQIFQQDGQLRVAPHIPAIVGLRQLLSGLKKLKMECEPWRTTNEVKDFISVELGCRSPTLPWEEDVLPVDRLRDVHLCDHHRDRDTTQGDLFSPELCSVPDECLETIQRTADIVSSSLGDFSLEEPTELPKNGPGVVSNHGKEVFKYSFRQWPRKLAAQFPHDLYASPSLGEEYRDDTEMSYWSENESASRLITVPKTMKGPRLIAAEPSQHQWIQQLIWNQLERRIASSPIRRSVNFRSQSQNQEKAILGSISGAFSTIDLSAASDRLTCWLVERLFRSNWTLVARLHASRTRWLRNDVRPHLGRFMRLRKFAAMGSACTFPVQTVCYASIAIGVVLYQRKLRPTSKNIALVTPLVQVFGDDIIVPTDSCELVCKVLTDLGLKVNHDKTFSTGNFRESCGVEAFGGHDVTVAYLLQPYARPSMSQVPSWIEVGNNFFRRGWWNVANYLRSAISDKDHLIPIVSPGDSAMGWLSFCGGSLDHLRRRYNENLQRDEYRVLLPYSSSDTEPSHGVFHLLQYFTERPDPLLKWSSGHRRKKVSSTRPGWSPPYTFPTISNDKRERWATA